MKNYSSVALKSYMANKDHQSPEFIYFRELIRERFTAINQNKPENIQFLFPVKCCHHPEILKLATAYFDGFDISNQNEFELIEGILRPEQTIWNSAPYPTSLNTNHSIFFSDQSAQGKKSLRINFNDNFQRSRFGESLSELNFDGAEAVHLHLGFQDNDTIKFLLVAKALKKSLPENVTSINFGGGFEFNTMNEMKECLEKIQDILPDKNLFFEPGKWTLKQTGFLIGKVLHIENLSQETRILTNISKINHLHWSTNFLMKVYPSTPSASPSEFHFVGPTCSEDDFLGKIKEAPYSVEKDNFIVVENISTYSIAWNREFNGIKAASFKLL